MQFFLRNRLELILMIVSFVFYILMLVMFIKFIYLRWPILMLPMAVGLVMSPVVSWRKHPEKKRGKVASIFYYIAIGFFVLGFIGVVLPFVLYFCGVSGAGFLGIIGSVGLLTHIIFYFISVLIADRESVDTAQFIN